MSKQTTKRIVPKLRFPEFRYADGWSYMNGNVVFDQISNKNHNSDLPILAITQGYGAIPRDEIDYNVVVSDKSVESYKVVDVGDFIISLRSFQGGIEYSNYRGICSPAYIILRKKNDVVENFFKYYFKTRLFIQELNRNIEGIRDGKMVSYKQFSDLLLPIPSSNEQQKIADCIFSIDDLITAQSQKLESLKAYKNGLIQQLFPAEGETVPKLRFPEFQDSGDWEVKKMGDITYKVSEKNKKGIKYPIYSINNKEGFLPQSDQFDGMDSNSRGYDISLYKIIERNTFAYNPARINVGSIGYSGELHNIIISSLYVCFKTKDFIDDSFLLFFLKTFSFNESVKKSVEGGIRNYLFYENFATINIHLPEKPEQQKIADFLSSIDELIVAQSQKLNAFNEHKKGLMQQLFPTLNEPDR